ncbi:MAG TPA: Asp-tRNA(Asn)/Glu-tRNA(Gln) amidotransferase subunit GatC [Pseudogracilibacillus sp.]|nr:Asp-tRNA(Asn)/Glu-tRNA(Gln) amidotransferase subunit GatC [Pseudogracilibacillus sp.]
MAKISKEQVLHTANLATLAISEEEAEMFSNQLTEIITFTEKIQNINTEGVKRTIYGNDNDNVLREDKAVRTITQEEALKNAPSQENGHFKVPSIMD